MYDIENLRLGTADVVAITPKLIADSLLEVARLKNVWMQFFNPIDISAQAGLQIEFPKENSGIGFTWDVSPGSLVTGTSMSYDATTIRVKKLGGMFELDREVLQSGIRDILKDHIYQAGLVYKESVDTIAYTVALGEATGNFAISTDGYTLNFGGTYPILEIVSVDVTDYAHTIAAINYVTGTIYDSAGNSTIEGAGGVTIAYKYAATATVAVHGVVQSGSDSGGSVSARGLAVGRAELIAKGRDPTFAVIKDKDIPNLLYDPNVSFLDASAYGGREPLMNMEIGKLWNQRVITTSRDLPDGVVVLIDKDRMGKWVSKRPLEAHRAVEEYQYDRVTYYLWSQFNAGVTDDQAICLVLFGTSSYPDTYPA